MLATFFPAADGETAFGLRCGQEHAPLNHAKSSLSPVRADRLEGRLINDTRCIEHASRHRKSTYRPSLCQECMKGGVSHLHEFPSYVSYCQKHLVAIVSAAAPNISSQHDCYLLPRC